MASNQLYYGDNLDIMRRYLKDESVDLVYLDPPFNSNADYNVLFAEKDGTGAASQIKAFGDTWHWDQESAHAFQEFVEHAPEKASQSLQTLRTLLGCNDMLAYISMMAPRILELKRVLKPTGSLYLHCDSTASHYLKIVLDSLFGKENFRNEIIWKRSTSHGNVSRNYGTLFDSIFFYVNGNKYKWNQQYKSFSEDYIKAKFRGVDPNGRRFQDVTLRNPGARPNLHYPYTASNGVTYQPHPNGWSCDLERMQKYDRENRLRFPTEPGRQLRLKMYLDESPGTKLQNVWDDIPAINSQAQERLGYPTQKPEALLERIILTSSSDGDVILDPFCGCGTTVSVAERLKRSWIGIDITHLAISLIKSRLLDAHGQSIMQTFKVVGEPISLPDAQALAQEKDRYQFQYWALGLVGARPLQADEKKGADKGIDGRLYFHDDAESGKTKQVIFSVKSGHLKPDDLRALSHVLDRERAEIGVLLSMEELTQKMRTDAASVDFYESPWGTRHPRLQILTVADLLGGKRIDMPPSQDRRTFKKAPKAKATPKDKYGQLPLEDDE